MSKISIKEIVELVLREEMLERLFLRQAGSVIIPPTSEEITFRKTLSYFVSIYELEEKPDAEIVEIFLNVWNKEVENE